MCKTLEPFDALYGDDCPINDSAPADGPGCGAEATTNVEECGGRVRGPFCPEHAKRIARGAHKMIEARRNCPRRVG